MILLQEPTLNTSMLKTITILTLKKYLEACCVSDLHSEMKMKSHLNTKRLQELTHLLVSKTCMLKVIIVGDWNTTLSHLDESGGLPWRETTYRNGLVNLMKELKKESTRGSSIQWKKLCIKSIYIVMRSKNC